MRSWKLCRSDISHYTNHPMNNQSSWGESRISPSQRENPRIYYCSGTETNTAYLAPMLWKQLLIGGKTRYEKNCEGEWPPKSVILLGKWPVAVGFSHKVSSQVGIQAVWATWRILLWNFNPYLSPRAYLDNLSNICGWSLTIPAISCSDRGDCMEAKLSPICHTAVAIFSQQWTVPVNFDIVLHRLCLSLSYSVEHLTWHIVIATLWNVEFSVSLVENHASVYKCTISILVTRPRRSVARSVYGRSKILGVN